MTDLALGARRRGAKRGRSAFTLLLAAGTLALAGAPAAYMVWPRQVAVAADAPTLPITVGNVTFNVPPAVIRVPMQRRTGAQGRIDLAFAWPSLTAPRPPDKTRMADAAEVTERMFVTIAGSDATLPPVERLKSIYPRYTAETVNQGGDGLVVRKFRSGTPYQGEELVYDPAAPERFILRCSFPVGAAQGTCLHERRLSGADVTVRFPRAWLSDWRAVESSIDRLIAGLRPSAT
jgi:hypothetical protein